MELSVTHKSHKHHKTHKTSLSSRTTLLSPVIYDNKHLICLGTCMVIVPAS